MSYIKQTWETGDIVTAEKLNHMEDGIASGGVSVLLVGEIYDEQTQAYRLDKTWQEIHDAAPLVWLMMTEVSGVYMPLMGVAENIAPGGSEVVYVVAFTNQGNVVTYITDSADGYPIEGTPSSDGDGEASGDTPIGEIGTNPKL